MWWLGLTWLWIIFKIIQPLLGCLPPPHNTLLSVLLLSSLFLWDSFLHLQVFAFLNNLCHFFPSHYLDIPPFFISWFLYISHPKEDLLFYFPPAPLFSGIMDQLELHICLLGQILTLGFLEQIWFYFWIHFAQKKQDQVNRGFQLLSAEFWVFSLKAVCIVLWISCRAHFVRGLWFLYVSWIMKRWGKQERRRLS